MSGFDRRIDLVTKSGSVQTVELCPHLKNTTRDDHKLGTCCQNTPGGCLACVNGSGLCCVGAPHPPGTTIPPPPGTSIPPPPPANWQRVPPPPPADGKPAARTRAAAPAAAGSPDESSSEPLPSLNDVLKAVELPLNPHEQKHKDRMVRRKKRQLRKEQMKAEKKARKKARREARKNNLAQKSRDNDFEGFWESEAVKPASFDLGDMLEAAEKHPQALPKLESHESMQNESAALREMSRRLADDHDAPHGVFVLLPVLMILMLVFIICRKHAKQWLSPTGPSSSTNVKSIRDNREKSAMRH